MCAIALAIQLERRSRSNTASKFDGFAFSAVCAVASFTHFYALFAVVFLHLAVALKTPTRRTVMALSGLGIVTAVATYVHFVTQPLAMFSTKFNWIGGNVQWYVGQIIEVLRSTIGAFAGIAVAGMIVLAAWIHIRHRENNTLDSREKHAGGIIPRLVTTTAGISLPTLLIFGPVFILIAGVASSVIVAPNLTARNVLTGVPFIWLGFAWLYDRSMTRLAGGIGAWVATASALLALLGGSVVLARSVPANEPWREADALMATYPDCPLRPVVVVMNEDPRWIKPGFSSVVTSAAATHYHRSGMAPVGVYARDIVSGKLPAGLTAALKARFANPSCPVVAEWVHQADPALLPAILDGMARALDLPDATIALKVTTLHYWTINMFGVARMDHVAYVVTFAPASGQAAPATPLARERPLN